MDNLLPMVVAAVLISPFSFGALVGMLSRGWRSLALLSLSVAIAYAAVLTAVVEGRPVEVERLASFSLILLVAVCVYVRRKTSVNDLDRASRRWIGPAREIALFAVPIGGALFACFYFEVSKNTAQFLLGYALIFAHIAVPLSLGVRLTSLSRAALNSVCVLAFSAAILVQFWVLVGNIIDPYRREPDDLAVIGLIAGLGAACFFGLAIGRFVRWRRGEEPLNSRANT